MDIRGGKEAVPIKRSALLGKAENSVAKIQTADHVSYNNRDFSCGKIAIIAGYAKLGLL